MSEAATAAARSPRPSDLGIAQAGVLLADGRLSPVELVESCLERVDALDASVRAWALVDRQGALEDARRAEVDLRHGRRRSPLHGIPVGVKDIFLTAGMRTEANSKVLTGFVPDHDATVVSRLREAGAIVLGKTHTAEFAVLDPPPTRNPWNLDHTPGGSSSGSGAAVAAGMCLAAMASQTGGSTVRPAAFTGVVGLKPRHGRVSTRGMLPISPALDHVGIMALSVEDVVLVLATMTAPDARDPYRLGDTAPDWAAALGALRPPRVALPHAGFLDHADENMRRNILDVAEQFAAAGATVDELILPPDFERARDVHRVLMTADCAATHRERYTEAPDHYGPQITAMIEEGLTGTEGEYAAALRDRAHCQHVMDACLEGVDALVTPAAPGAAPRSLASTGTPVMQVPWSRLGCPAGTVPSGLTDAGLPLGIQFVARSHPAAEVGVLAVARWCERALGLRLRPPHPPP